jgi:hypothetical protein
LRAEVPVEKAQLALLAVIALALCVQTWDRVVPEAHAQSTDVVCNAWEYVVGALKSDEKRHTEAMGYATTIRTWLLAHPGEMVFRTTLVEGAGAGSIDIACVRAP